MATGGRMTAEDDRFEQPERRRVPRAALAATAAVVVAGAIGLVARPDADPPGELDVDDDPSPPAPEETEPEASPEPEPQPADDDPDPDTELREATGSWRTLSEAPLSPRLSAPVWTGRELVVWGGQGGGFSARPLFDDGAAYDPDTDEWRELASAPLEPRGHHVAVWADGELLIWGGEGRTRLHDDGAAYDPDADSWTMLPPGPLSPRRDAVAAWVDGELVVAGGNDNAGPLADAAAYDPETREWRVVTDELPPGLTAPQARETVFDDRLVVWAARMAEPGGSSTFWRYDPGADRWDETETPPIEPESGVGRWVTTTDDALVAVSGQGPGGRPRVAIHGEDGWREVDSPPGSRGGPPDFVNPFARVAVAAEGRVYVLDDANEPLRYDLAEDTWTALPPLEPVTTAATPTLPHNYEAVAVDDGAVVWVGGVAEADAAGGDSPAGVLVWEPGD